MRSRGRCRVKLDRQRREVALETVRCMYSIGELDGTEERRDL